VGKKNDFSLAVGEGKKGRGEKKCLRELGSKAERRKKK